jgi:colanic acid biosynthesis glycosyl transferase WcaI
MVISCVFPPEFTFSATTSASIAEKLAATGHEVTVLAPFPNKPVGKLFPGYRRRLYFSRQMPEGYTLVHCFATLAPKSRLLSRFLENLTFGITAALRLLFAARPDVIYSNAWPVFATAIIAATARLRGVPLVLSVQDVYPESLASQGRIHAESKIFRLIRWIDTRVAHSARALILISERFRQIYLATRGVANSKLHLVYNWGDDDPAEPNRDAIAQYRRAMGIPQDAFLAVYGGNIGPASGAEGLIEAFGRLKDLEKVYLLIAGAGSNLESCVARSKNLGLDRVIFHSPWQREETDIVLGAADVLLLPTVGTQSLASMPSKLISYFFAGRPVIAMVLPESETANMIQAAGAGWIILPDNPDSLAATIRKVALLPALEVRALGEAGKAFARANLCRESNLPRVIHLLEAAATGNHSSEKAAAATSSV